MPGRGGLKELSRGLPLLTALTLQGGKATGSPVPFSSPMGYIRLIPGSWHRGDGISIMGIPSTAWERGFTKFSKQGPPSLKRSTFPLEVKGKFN